MMRRGLLFFAAVLIFTVGLAFGNENIALLENGGSVEFPGVAYTNAGVEHAFDGDRSSQFAYDVVRQPANRNVGVDRIWDSKVKINKIEMRTTGAGRAYEYKFLYWDLAEREWKEIVHVDQNSSSNPIHNFKTPITTNKIRYICLKAGENGTNNFHNIYQIYYYGEFIPNIPTNAPENVQAQINETGFISVSWDTPKANNDGEIPESYNVYRSNKKDFKPNKDNLVGESIKGNRWFDITAQGGDSFYYIVQSIGEFGDGEFSQSVQVK